MWGAERGIIVPSSSLWSYEEIVSSANAEGYEWPNTIAELNNHIEEYYEMLNRSGHMVGTYVIYIDATYNTYGTSNIGICYNTNDKRWIAGSWHVIPD